MSSLMIAGWGDASFSLRAAVAAQIARAGAGSSLTDYRRAEDFPLFLKPATEDTEARYKAAWWLAVAARLLGGNLALTTKAASLAARAGASAPLMGLFEGSDQVTSIYRDAAEAIRSAAGARAGSDPNLRAALAALGYHATSGAVAVETQARYEMSPRGQAEGTIVKTVQDLVPGGAGKTPWWLWAIYIGVPIVLVGGLYLWSSPYRARAERAYGAARQGWGL